MSHLLADGSPCPEHHCHAVGCIEHVPPELLMCCTHWAMVPPKLRRNVLQTYRPGQCDDKKPSEAWRNAAGAAIKAVHEKES